MASANRGATDNLHILSPNAFSFSLGGTVSVTITYSKTELAICSNALPENKAWVAKANTLLAPIPLRTLAASDKVPYIFREYTYSCINHIIYYDTIFILDRSN